MEQSVSVACDHNGREPARCWSFECRAAAWRGPGGITADDLRYSVVYTIEARFRIGERWPRPAPLDGVAWQFWRRESCNGEDGFVAYVYGAAMDRAAFEDVIGSAESDGESGGIFNPAELPGTWAPSVILLRETWRYERFTVTAWRADRALDDEDLFDEWPDVCALLSGKLAWSGQGDPSHGSGGAP